MLLIQVRMGVYIARNNPGASQITDQSIAGIAKLTNVADASNATARATIRPGFQALLSTGIPSPFITHPESFTNVLLDVAGRP